MQLKFVSKSKNCRRLILIYAGWAMDWRPFRGLAAHGYDIAVVWDYRELTADWSRILSRYDEVCLLAWSFGVFAASVTMHELLPHITKRIAVNGTLAPIDAVKGINPDIFAATLEGMSPNNLRRFYRSMFLTKEQYDAFRANAPKRDIDEAIAELEAFETHTIFHAPQVEEWDLAIISEHDRIFMPQAQLAAWHGRTNIRRMATGHMPDFGVLINQIFIDKDLVTARFADSHDTYSANAVVQKRIASRLHGMLAESIGGGPLLGNIIEVGVGDGSLTDLYAPTHDMGTVALWDIAGVSPELVARTPNARPEQCDAEIRMRRQQSESAAYILSASTIQWFNSPKAFLRECARVLVPGGWLAVSTFVRGNLGELAATIGNGMEVPTGEAWHTMIPENLEVEVRHEEVMTLHFDSPRDVLRHMSLTGVNAVRFHQSPIVLARRILANYPADRGGKYPVTFRPIYIIARKKED